MAPRPNTLHKLPLTRQQHGLALLRRSPVPQNYFLSSGSGIQAFNIPPQNGKASRNKAIRQQWGRCQVFSPGTVLSASLGGEAFAPATTEEMGTTALSTVQTLVARPSNAGAGKGTTVALPVAILQSKTQLMVSPNVSPYCFW
ncbi:hypothetical protein FVEG_14064 [Fusarium verticillioides 7600]|uniref:Uncharacterized protein n=1 Tax=Gibberella moniliformis (strain M3125 / FGSC 7600) TaxID=334819 RepID=W7NHQ9_GIBM7|nr:hypothetical protein FVEG_14064 [Fusarium verticillioides 7600]EWG55957.1 hypothetical protein FVEG_14064 [Fusarium verticillioides 7600]